MRRWLHRVMPRPQKTLLTALLVTMLVGLHAAGPVLAQSPAAATDEFTMFPTASNVLAQFEFEGNANEVSGSGRSGQLLGGEYVATDCGTGLKIGANTDGFDWSAHANQLVHPYTVEMVLTPEQTSSYAKLFSDDKTQDRGWYYFMQSIRLYPTDTLAQGAVQPNQRHYLAFVSTSAETVDVYFQGVRLGEGRANFTAPPKDALFFQDDTSTGRGEMLRGVVDALRISSVARTATEIAQVQNRIAKCVFDGPTRSLFLPSLSN